ncbi:MAG: VanW family protein, partial [Lachnospiraceae bacterium]
MMKNWKRYLSIAALTMVLALAVIITIPVNANAEKTNTIPQRVYVGEISVGGMTKEEAQEAVDSYIGELQSKVITLMAGENTLEVTAGDFGITWRNPEVIEEALELGKSGNLIARYKAAKDLEHEDKVYQIAYGIDHQKVVKLLESNKDTLNTKAINAGLERKDGKFIIIPGSQGVTVNSEESITILESYFTKEWKGTDQTVELAAEVAQPKGTEEELGKVKDVLGSFNTSYSSSASGRSQNVTNGTQKINGSVVYPGDTFSVYEAVNPFNAENGYELAGSYENGATVDTYGGGICQVSTTLYNAVIRAELNVVER